MAVLLGEGGDDGSGKAGTLPKRAAGVAKVAQNVAQPFGRALVVALVLGEFDGPEFLARALFGFGAAQTATHVVADLLIEMEAELGIHSSFPDAAAARNSHSVVSRTSEMASHRRFQPSVSDSSWRRPSRVRL